jgi:hypothetical protein
VTTSKDRRVSPRGATCDDSLPASLGGGGVTRAGAGGGCPPRPYSRSAPSPSACPRHAPDLRTPAALRCRGKMNPWAWWVCGRRAPGCGTAAAAPCWRAPGCGTGGCGAWRAEPAAGSRSGLARRPSESHTALRTAGCLLQPRCCSYAVAACCSHAVAAMLLQPVAATPVKQNARAGDR